MVGIKKGLVTGIAAGFIWVLIFGAFGLAFWYGTQMVIDREATGGDILQVGPRKLSFKFFCPII